MKQKSEKKIKNKKVQGTKESNKKNKIIKKTSAGRGLLVVFPSFNNTIFTITYENGEKIGPHISARTATGYSGTKKATPFAAQEAARKVLDKLKEVGISSVKIVVHGGTGNG
jgi:small subunit ribosomal protein S11